MPLSSRATLDVVGGKGRSLASLIAGGFPVPDGFHVTTAAYRQFVVENELEARLPEAAAPEVIQGTLSFAAASERIRALFDQGAVPESVCTSVARAYFAMTETLTEAGATEHAEIPPPVAVRSSATAEDLPDLSFAGQQDTYLNVRELEPLLKAIRNCWASLWTDRALSYRFRMGIDQDQIAMAVVVQRMADADVAGVLFTANPATGDRTEMIANASFGLGEAIVSGEVTPDTYVFDRESLTVKETAIGTKAQMVVADGEQGTAFQAVAADRRDRASLATTELQALGRLALQVEEHFDGVPQDIEWLFAGGALWLLQSRPITNLPPAPLEDVRWERPEPGAFLGRSQLVEHIPDPVSTLFEDLHMKRSLQRYWGRNLARRGNHTFEDTQPPASFVVQDTINGYAYRHVGEPPRTGRPTPAKVRRPRLPGWIQRRLLPLRMYLLFVPEWRYRSLPRYLREVQKWRALDPQTASVEQLWTGIREMSKADARYWYQGGAWHAFALTRGTEFELHNFLQEHAPGRFTSGQFLSGLPSPAFDAQIKLWSIARLIQAQPTLHAAVIATPPRRLLERLAEHPEGAPAHAALADYFRLYGHQIFTLDFAEPSEAEDPASLMQSLHALVLQHDYDPEATQRALAVKRRTARSEALAFFQGPLQRRFRWLLWKARHYYPNREEAMFHMGKAWTVLRPLAKELGRRLVEVGTLQHPDDIFFLTADELGRAIRGVVMLRSFTDRGWDLPGGAAIPEYRQLTADRRELREARRHLNPPDAVPGGVPWAQPNPAEERDGLPENILKGSPVSPGQVTGEVSLVLSPAEFSKMRPGTILVCPTTTPAWTQLFPQAKGLVTDIGGMLAHGSIVAREYGIPAVLGVGDATRRIEDGQTITVDGNLGTVTMQ